MQYVPVCGNGILAFENKFLLSVAAGLIVVLFFFYPGSKSESGNGLQGRDVFQNKACSSLSLQRPHKANAEEMTKYHSDDYIKFLRSIRPDNMSEYSKQMQRCKLRVQCCSS